MKYILLLILSLYSNRIMAQATSRYISYYVYKNDSSVLRTFNSGPQILFNEKLAQLHESIANDSLPRFFYDECLDDDFYVYCVPSIHKVRSFRRDLIYELNLSELMSVIRITNKKKRNALCKICAAKDDNLIFWDVPTYDLVFERIIQLQSNR